MSSIRSFLGARIRSHYENQDTYLGQRGMFGLDAIADIRRLTEIWNQPIRTAFDVGANDGDTAVELLRRFPEVKVVSFEPHPGTYKQLNDRIGQNARFSSFNLALGNQSGEAEMVEYENSKINSLLSESPFAHRFNEKGRSIPVKTITLDTFCEQQSIANIDLLKIDTEGCDLQVLEGSRRMLRAGSIKFIYTEFNDLVPGGEIEGGALLPLATLLSDFEYRFVASYNDYITTDGDMFGVSNALFVLPPKRD